MKCIILSDSHGASDRVDRVLRMHRDAEVIFFLGDGLSDLDGIRIPDTMQLFGVRGNCDFYPLLPDGTRAEKLGSITLCSHRILYTHGDLYGVKYHDEGLLQLAREQRGSIVLFGHTHLPREHYASTDGVYLFNPGSLGAGLGSFGILQLDERNVLFSHGTLL